MEGGGGRHFSKPDLKRCIAVNCIVKANIPSTPASLVCKRSWLTITVCMFGHFSALWALYSGYCKELKFPFVCDIRDLLSCEFRSHLPFETREITHTIRGPPMYCRQNAHPLCNSPPIHYFLCSLLLFSPIHSTTLSQPLTRANLSPASSVPTPIRFPVLKFQNNKGSQKRRFSGWCSHKPYRIPKPLTQKQ